ncbi:peroxidase [Methylococcus sp. EFPC2]|uniref:Dyp-type peroxidase n=1 Tax=Methylococcus sp. EFPC2 TaxID=2812648 RepID=UPI0019671FC4|nr:peroxidase [Methylococcus sp. EFPC2]QSA97800.1 peroxidase [Methylococcus sp. EFPC2]
MSREVELDDIQGLVRFAYGHLKQACFVLLRVKEQKQEAARTWLAQLPVTSAIDASPPPDRALQVALSCEGLRALGVGDDILQGFSVEFVAGMAGDENRSRRLGDVDDSAPTVWQWGASKKLPHVLVMLYAKPDALETWKRQVLKGCSTGFQISSELDTSDMDGREPFGFVDGISQPKLDWKRQRAVRDQELEEYTNLSCLGEFLLGYPNEYGLYTDRPLLDPQGAAAELPRAEDVPEKADLGRNGSYLVFRQLHQDVAGFWQTLDRQAEGDATLRTRYAEAMVGRSLDGKPLVQSDGLNGFDYRADTQGLRCPIGAHIRRANPRNGDIPPGKPGLLGWLCRILGYDARAREQDLIASTRFHRLVRRGREYGQPITIDQALTGTETEAGLHFICLNANIARQFEFVQSAWLTGTRFGGLDREGDPLLGARTKDLNGGTTDHFSMPQAYGADQRLEGLPRFVSVKGGAYFFLPGIRALRYLVTAT